VGVKNVGFVSSKHITAGDEIVIFTDAKNKGYCGPLMYVSSIISKGAEKGHKKIE
jgi:hypothetical protein